MAEKSSCTCPDHMRDHSMTYIDGDNYRGANQWLDTAMDQYSARRGSATPTEAATFATAHAVLALIDIITGDRENEIQEAYNRIADLESMLAGCREALRQRENAEANSAKQET